MTKQLSKTKPKKQHFGERIQSKREREAFERAYEAAFAVKPDYVTTELTAVTQYLTELRSEPYSD